MSKNWLIRTRSNHILGPVSKEKVLDLYNNGSIKPDDEICSGNGYWFFIREDDLVKKYLLGNEIQSFNPISEAKDVLTASAPSEVIAEEFSDDITLVGGINLQQLQEPAEASEKAPEVPQEISKSSKKKIKTEKSEKTATNINIKMLQKHKKQNYFKYVGLGIFIVLVILIYFRKTILKSFFESAYIPKIELIASANAQDTGKKKVF